MSTQIKYRGGTAADHASFTGADREITVDTTNGTIRVHDGVTVGGIPLARADLANASGTAGQAVASGASTPGSCSVVGDLFYNSTDGKIYVCNGSNYVASVSNAAPTSGASTPGSCSLAGELFFNETDEKLYVCNGATYERATPDVAASSGASTPGSCSIVGELFFNETDQKLYICNGSTYDAAVSEATTASGASTPGSCSLEGGFFFNTTEEKLYVCQGGTYTLAVPTSAQIEEGSLTVAAFASSIRPVELFGTLPITGNTAGRLVFLTTDNKLYRYNGSAFVSTIPTSDLTGTIAAGQIAANAVTAGTIAAGAVTATEIASSAITTDKLAAGSVLAGNIATNAITSDKILANAIVAGKIATAAVDATNIATNAITASKILAGTITSAKIGAGEIKTNNLETNAVTADKILAGSITAAKIQTGAVTVDKISAGTTTIATGKTFALGEGATIASFGGVGAFTSTAANTFGILCSASGSGSGAFAAGFVGSGSAGGFYNSTTTAYTTHYTTAVFAGSGTAGTFNHVANSKTAYLCNASWAGEFYGGVGPFTGAHDGLVPKTETQPVVGDILVDVTVYAKPTINDSLCVNSLSTIASQLGAIGVLSQYADSAHIPLAIAVNTPNADGSVTRAVNSQYTDIGNYNKVIINSIGEGCINVCGENGNIAVGDLIVTSNIAGKGMKQSDDIVRSSTVAKAREAVTFNSPSEVKQIACIYMCG